MATTNRVWTIRPQIQLYRAAKACPVPLCRFDPIARVIAAAAIDGCDRRDRTRSRPKLPKRAPLQIIATRNIKGDKSVLPRRHPDFSARILPHLEGGCCCGRNNPYNGPSYGERRISTGASIGADLQDFHRGGGVVAFCALCEAACEQNGVAQTIGTVLPQARQAPQACDCETPFRSVDILRRPADADRAHLTVGTAMISARCPVCRSLARSWQRPGPMQKVRPRFAIFWLLLLACLALSAADVAWACQSPDQAQLPSQANMLADGALDPKDVASPSDDASAAVAEQALKSSSLRCRCLRLGYERLGANKSRTEYANLARAPPSAQASLCRRFGSARLPEGRPSAAVYFFADWGAAIPIRSKKLACRVSRGAPCNKLTGPG